MCLVVRLFTNCDLHIISCRHTYKDVLGGIKMVELYATSGFPGKRVIHFKICCENPAGTKNTHKSYTAHASKKKKRIKIFGHATEMTFF